VIYFFHSEAESEHLENVSYYESRRVGLGARYLQDFDEVMAYVMERPDSFRIERQPDIRRASLKRFPYKVVYRVAGTAVQILAVSHARRRPGYWAGRS
jgi:hypothetical protein